MFRPDADSSGPEDGPETAGPRCDILKQFALLLTASERSMPGLMVGTLGSLTEGGDVVDREKGVAVAYCPLGAGAEVRFWVSERRAKLLTRTTEPAGIRTEITDRVALSLRQPLEFAGEVMPSTQAVAAALLSLIRRRVTDAGLTNRAVKGRSYDQDDQYRGAPRRTPGNGRHPHPRRESTPSPPAVKQS